MRFLVLFLAALMLAGCGTLMRTKESYVRMQADKVNMELNGPYLNGRIDAEKFLFISAPGKAKDATGAEEIYDISEEFYPTKGAEK